MMFNRQSCYECAKQATVEISGRYYCGAHALDKVRTTNPIPPVKMINPSRVSRD